MPHALTELKLAEVTRPTAAGSEPVHQIRADVCVVGAGIAGLSAAIESARLHRDVVLVDSLPVIGGQMVHSLIGLFCGVFGNGPDYRQLTHGIFDDIFRDLGPSGDLHFQRGHTMTVFYNEVVLGRWLEQTVRSIGIRAVLGTVLQHVDITDGRLGAIDLASRYGNVQIRADSFPGRSAGPGSGPTATRAAGRCADGDAAALSSVRVMGPCAAMGAGAAHALDLAARADVSVHDVDVGQLHERLAANLDPPP
jgi:hypothetical protein